LGRLRCRGFEFRWYVSDHPPPHIHVTTPETLRDCVYDAGAHEFLVTFRDGRMYRLPRGLLPEDDGSEVLSVGVDRDGSAFVVRQRSGNSFEVPWDFVLYNLEPGYPYYKGRSPQRRLEEDAAVRIGRKLRELRQEKRLTTYELARRSGIHRPNISRMESGKHIQRSTLLVGSPLLWVFRWLLLSRMSGDMKHRSASAGRDTWQNAAVRDVAEPNFSPRPTP